MLKKQLDRSSQPNKTSTPIHSTLSHAVQLNAIYTNPSLKQWTPTIINFIVSNREISINGRRSASAQLAEPGIEPRTFQLLGRRSIH
jgi:hypothetical protein